ncbi:MAG: T9SS type A sorting domain-containing protein [Ignavibacteriales bacterium]|nr:T9SS type A sorting domain-containing protein [Ignavibacteriales bacterium]
MKTKYLFSKVALIIFSTMVLFQSTINAQEPKFRVMVTIEDSLFDAGMVFKKVVYDTVLFGYHPNASYCLEPDTLHGFTDRWVENWRGSVYDSSMFEEETPPLAPEFGFVTNNASSGCGLVGLFNLLHKYVSPTQLDTINLKVQSKEFDNSKMTLRWPKNMSEYFTSANIKNTALGVDFNMLTDTSGTFSWNVNDYTSAIFKIWIVGIKNPPLPPVAPSAIYPPTGVMGLLDTVTVQWSQTPNAYRYHFQFGTDSTFKKGILKDTIFNRTNYNLSGLKKGTWYYWRVLVQTAYGISYYQNPPYKFGTVFSPPIPRKIYPDSAQSNVPLNSTFKWYRSASENPVTYRIQVASDSTFNTILKDSTTLDSLMSFGGITTNCSTYYWRISAKDIIGTSDYSTIWSFKSAWFTPVIPTLVSPVDAATNQPQTLTLSWTGDICTQNFHLQVAKDVAFSQIIVDRIVSQLSQQISGLEEDKQYYWKVKSKNPVDSSDYSVIRSFTTILNPAAIPVIVSPANGDTNRNPVDVLRWRKVLYADLYHVQIALDQNFTNLISNDSTLTDTSFTTPSLNNCISYYWKVNAKNRVGSVGYTATRNFKIKTAVAGPPILDEPVNNKDSLSENVTLRWHANDPCTNYYQFHVSKNSLFTDTVEIGTTSSTTYDLKGLQGNFYYYWHVRAVNYLGPGAYSTTFVFHTTKSTPFVPVLLEPVDDLGDVSDCMTFKWDSATFASSYRLQVARDSNFSNLIYNDSLILRVPGVQPSKRVCLLPNATKLYWRVNAKNEIGTSKWSLVRKFSTLYPPSDIILTKPLNGEEAIPLRPTFIWSLPDRANFYQLQVARDTMMVELVFNDSSIVLTSWTIIDPLINYTKYYWRVRGKNSAGWGNWSSTNSFRTTRVGVANWLMPLTIAEYGPEKQSIYFGLNPEATKGIDPSRGEYELPPPLYGYFDARFISPYIGEGLLVDYHEFVSYSQRDTFQFRFQPGMGSYPMTISWYKTGVKDVCDSMVITDRLVSPTIRTRMDIDSFLVVNNSTVQSLYILLYAAYPYVDVKPVVPEIPKGFVLYQNYPNPFNPSTKIHFTTDKEAKISVTIYDMLGREISVLTHSTFMSGGYTFEWNGKNSDGIQMPSGVYYARMVATARESDAQPFVVTRKMIMMK